MQMATVHEEVKDVQQTLTETRELAREEKDKESRVNNVILYRIPESNADTPENRHKEDCHFATHLFDAVDSGLADEDIVKAFRLGKRQPNAAPRPLLLQLGSRMAKSLLMNVAYKLKDCPAKFRNVVIAHDMTVKERQECRELVDKAKEKTEEDTSGNWVYKVRGPPGQLKIVRFRRTQD